MTITGPDAETLRALCDVFVPAVRPPASATEVDRRWFATRASDVGTDERLRHLLPELLDEDELGELSMLLRVLRLLGIGRLPYQAAQAVLRGLSLDDDADQALRDLRQLTMVIHYGSADERGDNPFWEQLGFPGPGVATTRPGPRLPVVEPDPHATELVLEAEAVVVGSGAGGGVIAARLAAAGTDVVVVEAGGAATEEDFPGDEFQALRSLYWRGGLTQTEDRNVTLLAGGTLGGGTTVNWSNCVAPPTHVRTLWARDHGLEGVDGPAFDEHLDAVGDRIGASDAATTYNGPNQRMLEGATALGWDHGLVARNVDADREDPAATGLTGYGDRSGAKQGSLRTWLPDAAADGARILTGCEVERVLTIDGRAAGVVGTWTAGDRRVAVTVHAPTVILAAGALETPAILLRSGLGGPAAGRHLRVHPVPVLRGIYDEDQQPWSGPPQGLIIDEFAQVRDGHGYLIESSQWHPGLTAGSIAWPDARDHKLIMGRDRRTAPFLAVVRERGSGRVTLDARGRGIVHYPLDDELDRDVLRHATRQLATLHAAAGAQAIVDLVRGGRVWRRGQSVEAFAEALSRVPLGAEGRSLFSAHQMGSARMGPDPRTSVADTDGQVHDTPGLWIGDASAFPTAVGSNPMLTVMALASRTADRLLRA